MASTTPVKQPFPAQSHQAIIRAVSEAACATWFVRSQNYNEDSWSKSDKTPVTVADLASQAIILSAVAEIAPQEKVLAEEEIGSLNDDNRASRVREVVEEIRRKSFSVKEIRECVGYRGDPEAKNWWLVDPLDGTKGFILGLVYSIAVARIVNGSLDRSWMAAPGKEDSLPGVIGHLFHAVRGQGAYRSHLNNPTEETRLPHLPESYIPPLLVAGSRAHGGAELPKPILDAGISAVNIPLDSQAKYAAIAVGAAHLYPRKHSTTFGYNFAWDHGPGTLLVQECGGVVTDLHGDPLDFSTGKRLSANVGILAASSPKVHNQFLDLLRYPKETVR